MSKITFRADDDLVRQLEEFDASKSEVMREALRFYLENAERDSTLSDTTVEDALADRIDKLVDRRLDERLDEQENDRSSGFARNTPQDVNVNVLFEGASTEDSVVERERTTKPDTRKTPAANADEGRQTERNTCVKCGEQIGVEHVYCPNCGEKASQRVFCDCGDELRSDWAFCPSCGRRTPAADVLDNR